MPITIKGRVTNVERYEPRVVPPIRRIHIRCEGGVNDASFRVADPDKQFDLDDEVVIQIVSAVPLSADVEAVYPPGGER